MSVLSSQAVSITFRTKNIDGVLADATGTPTAVLYRNGTATAVVVTVASITGTGRYSASWTNASYAVSDQLEIEITATVGGVAYTSKVWSDGVVAVVPTAVENSIQIAEDVETQDNSWDVAIAVLVEQNRLVVERAGGMLDLKPTAQQNSIQIANQTAILAAIAALPTSVQNSRRISDDIVDEINNWQQASEQLGNIAMGTVERQGGMLDLKPTASAIATAVRTELTPELNRIDETISSRATPNDVNITIDQPIIINPTILDENERILIASSINVNIEDGIVKTLQEAMRSIQINIDANPQRVLLGPCKTDVQFYYHAKPQ